jgi:hypothetical protein
VEVQEKRMINRTLYYTAATTTAIAGILHLIVALRPIGIAGTIILIIMWTMTRMPGNPITGRGGPISNMGIAIEVFQIAYVVLTAIIIGKEEVLVRQLEDKKIKKHV